MPSSSGYPQGGDVVESAFSEAFLTHTRVSTVDWASDNVVLDHETEGRGGPLDFVTYPYAVEILQAFDDPEIRTITVVAGTQLGKTVTMLTALLSGAQQDPAPGMLVVPDQIVATEYRDRVYSLCLGSDSLSDLVPPRKSWNLRHIELFKSRVYLAWSGSGQRLRGRPCKRVFLSEIDAYQFHVRAGDPVMTARERTKAFWRPKIFQESSPLGDDSPIWREYERGDMRRWLCPCPECGKWQELRFFPLRGADMAGLGGILGYRRDGELLSPEDARSEAKYICMEGCEIPGDRKAEMVAAGRWLPRGQWISRTKGLVGEPARQGNHASFHLWSIHAPTISIGDIAANYVEHVEAGLAREFAQNWLGIRWKGSSRARRWEETGRRLEGEHDRGTVPEDAYFLTAGVDVQEDGIYWVVRAWGDQRQSWLVDWGYLRRFEDADEADNDLAQLQSAVIGRSFPVAGDGRTPMGKPHLRCAMVAIDANYRTDSVHEFVRNQADTRVRAVRGDSSVKPSLRFRATKVVHQGHVDRLWGIAVDVYKQMIFDKMVAGRTVRGTFWFCKDVVKVGREYLRQATNEESQLKRDDEGRKKRRFVIKNKQVGNHYWDTEIYAAAAADMHLRRLGVTWNAEDWNRKVSRNSEPAYAR